MTRMLDTSLLQLLLAGVYFVLGVTPRGPSLEGSRAPEGVWPCYSVASRYDRRMEAREARRGPIPIARDSSALRHFLPRNLSPTQFLERSTQLSVMGRFQIYNWLYYRWEFWRYGAIKLRCRLMRSACVRAISATPGGLCDAHIAPD